MDLKSKIKSKLLELDKTTKSRDNIWKPEVGSQVIRIVPYKFDPSFPFIELYFHYEINKKTYLSPTSFGKPDPIAEFADKLKETGDTDDWKMGNKLSPKMRTYVPVLVRGKENEGVKFWGFGKTVYHELLSLMDDSDYGDITSLKDGRDITVIFKTPEETGKTWPETSIRAKPNTSPVSDDPTVIEKIKNQIKITELFKEYTYDELKLIFKNWFEGNNEETETDEKPKSTSEKPKSSIIMADEIETPDEFKNLKFDKSSTESTTDQQKEDEPLKSSTPDDLLKDFDDMFE